MAIHPDQQPGAETMRIRAILEWDDECEADSATYSELNFASSSDKAKWAAIANLKDAAYVNAEADC